MTHTAPLQTKISQEFLNVWVYLKNDLIQMLAFSNAWKRFMMNYGVLI